MSVGGCTPLLGAAVALFDYGSRCHSLGAARPLHHGSYVTEAIVQVRLQHSTIHCQLRALQSKQCVCIVHNANQCAEVCAEPLNIS